MTGRPDLTDLRKDYLVGLLRLLPSRDEHALTAGYQLGRDCVEQGVSLLDLVSVHHDVLAEVLRDTPAQQHERVILEAGGFLREVLACTELVQRSLLDPG